MEFEPIVEEWVNDYSDEISEDFGEFIPIVKDSTLLKDIIGQLVKEYFVGHPESKIILVEERAQTDENLVTVQITRILVFEVDEEIDAYFKTIPLQISKRVYCSVNYRLNIKNGEVKDHDIDLESFSFYFN
ncbi:hypothetical protein ACFLWK_00780 [Chloroflexota bacterium]